MKSLLKILSILSVITFAATAETKKLIVATDTAFMPFEFKQGDKYVGFDIDLWEAIAQELNLSYTLKPMDFSGVIPALQSRNVDLAIAGIAITELRKEVIDFSDVYYSGGLLVLVRMDNDDIKSEKDLSGKIVAVKSGTESANYAKDNINAGELRQFPNIDNAYMELAAKRADAVLYDAPNILAFMKFSGNTQFKTVGNQIKAQHFCIALPKGSDELRKKINTALQTLRDNGTYAQIYKKWFDVEPD